MSKVENAILWPSRRNLEFRDLMNIIKDKIILFQQRNITVNLNYLKIKTKIKEKDLNAESYRAKFHRPKSMQCTEVKNLTK